MTEYNSSPQNPGDSEMHINTALADALLDSIEADNALDQTGDQVGALYRKFRDGEIGPEDYYAQQAMLDNDQQAQQLRHDALVDRINNGGEAPTPQPPVHALARGVLWLLNRRK